MRGWPPRVPAGGYAAGCSQERQAPTSALVSEAAPPKCKQDAPQNAALLQEPPTSAKLLWLLLNQKPSVAYVVALPDAVYPTRPAASILVKFIYPPDVPAGVKPVFVYPLPVVLYGGTSLV